MSIKKLIVLLLLFCSTKQYAQVQEGQLYKEISRPEVFVIQDGKKVLLPTNETLIALGYTRQMIHDVPDGTLARIPLFVIPSNSATPGSLIFPAVGGVHYAKKISTSQRVGVKCLGCDDVQLVELRGWLLEDILPLGSDGRRNIEKGGFDLGFGFIPDYRWLESQGIDINKLIMVGNFTLADDIVFGSTNDKIVKRTPIIKGEINSWLWQDQMPAGLSKPPSDWLAFKSASGVVYWPFNPNFRKGQYVSIYGSLVHDSPHSGVFSYLWEVPGKRPREIDKWSPGWPWAYPGEGKDHWARWTEVHPVDKITFIDNRPQVETVFGLLLTSNVSDCNSMTVGLKPNTPRPPNSVVAYKELVGAESFDPNRNPQRHFTRVTKFADSIVVTANTCGDNTGSPGRIKAIYRLWWEPAPAIAGEMRITLSSFPLATNVPVNFSVLANDKTTNQPVIADVFYNNIKIGTTNTSIQYTFRPLPKKASAIEFDSRGKPIKVTEVVDTYAPLEIRKAGYKTVKQNLN